ncbi:MAG: RsmB/NOP family class I SAM-dependent RNA methyltransferase [Alphaproteobacteria bacterium]
MPAAKGGRTGRDASNRGAEPTVKAGAVARTVAVDLLTGVLDHAQPLDSLLADADNAALRGLDGRDLAFVRAVVGTTLRRLGEIDATLDTVLERRPDSRAFERILQVAIAQILFMETADHAAVSLAVDQVGSDRKARRYRSLANAVLRRITRERPAIGGGEMVNMPAWLGKSWVDHYGAGVAAHIAATNQVEPYLDLTARGDAAAVAAALDGHVLPTGSVRLIPKGPVEKMAGYEDGTWWVQDAAAALPARLLGDVAGRRVADLCAAPGGKTAQLAALGARVSAVDSAAQRMQRLEANMTRLGLTAETVVSDVLTWRPADAFDAILLDAPCSSTGTIRRHPDIAFLKNQKGITTLSRVQAAMIDHAAGLLKPGGTLVYCTCSLEPEEGEQQLAGALSRNALSIRPITAGEIGGLEGAITPQGTVRTLPQHMPMPKPRLSGLDGFFIMRLVKPG